MGTKLWPIAAALISAGLLALCFPGFNVSGAIWLWMLPLTAALWLPKPGISGRRRVWRGFALGYLCGFAFFAVNMSWLGAMADLPNLPNTLRLLPFGLALYLGLFFALWGAFAASVGRPRFIDHPADPDSRDPLETQIRPAVQSLASAALNGSAWCGLELLRGWLFGGFGWNGLGVALHRDLVMAQAADLVGVTGLAFMLVFVSSVATGVLLRLYREIRRGKLRGHLDFAAAVVLIVMVFFYGTGKLSEKPSATLDVRVLLVQAGVPQEDKWDASVAAGIYRKYSLMTRRYLEIADFDLVLWPESSLPDSLGSRYNREYLNELLAIKDFELVLGLNEEEIGEGLYNSIVALRGSVIAPRTYRKVRLVPFGEYIPLRGKFPPFEWIAGGMIDWDFSAGESTEPIAMQKPEPYGAIPLVCFEDTIGRHARKFVREGAQLIINVTNDGWFAKSSAAEQHLANARFRCIELRRPMARSTNTGVTCLVDSCGSLYDRWIPGGGERKVADHSGNIFIEDSLPEMIRIPRDPPMTLYARHGDWFSISAGCIAALVVLLRAGRGRFRVT